MNNVNNTRTLRGTLIMLAGLALLLHTLGLMDIGISLVLVIIAIYAIVYGFYISGLYDWCKKYIGRK